MNSRVQDPDWVDNTFTYRPFGIDREERIGSCLGDKNTAIQVGRIPREDLMSLPIPRRRPAQVLVSGRLVLLAPVVNYREGAALLYVRTEDGWWREYRFSPREYGRYEQWREDLEELDKSCSGSDEIWDVDPQDLTIVVENHSCIVRTLVFRLSADGNSVTLERVVRVPWYVLPLLEWAKQDPRWDIKSIRGTVGDTYVALERFVAGGPLTDLRAHLSSARFEDLSSGLYQPRGLNVDVRRMELVAAMAFADPTRDRIWIYFPSPIEQFWKFVRTPTGWGLDQIDDSPSAQKFQQFRVARVEDLHVPAGANPEKANVYNARPSAVHQPAELMEHGGHAEQESSSGRAQSARR